MKRQATLPLAAAFAAALTLPLAAQVEGHHGQTHAEYQTTFDSLSGQGYRPIALSIHGSVGDERYTSVWVHRGGPDWFGFHGATGAEYQAIVDAACLAGYTPDLLTATGSFANARFAGTFVNTATDCYARHGLTEAEFWAERSAAAQAGWRIHTADIYGSGGDPRYIVSFKQASVGQMALVSSNGASYQGHFNAMSQGHARPYVATNDSGRYLSIWRSDNVGAWVSHHGMTAAEYQNNFDTYGLANFYPITVQASGSGGNTFYAATWAQTDLPTPGDFTITGQAVPGFSAYDDWVRDWMTDNEIRSSNLAIVKQGRLVYCRGYTLTSDPFYPITQPATQCRIASCTKPLTSIGIHQLFEPPAPNLDATDPMMNFFGAPVPQDAQCNNISVYDLLTHQGGWDRNVSPDPMLIDGTVSGAMAVPIPIAKTDIFNYVIGQTNLDFAPSSQSQYSNFGYSVLGQIIEERTGVDYETYMRRNVFTPLGITRATVTPGKFSDLKPDEMFYHPYFPWYTTSVCDAAQPNVAGQYGGFNIENMDSHGGWVMAAPDFAKVLAAFDLQVNPILGEDQTNAMWTVAPGFSTLMSGWFKRDVDDGNGGTTELVTHNGRLIGSTNVIARRDDGYSFVFFCNGDKTNLGTNQAEELSDIANTIPVWPNHDLFPTVGLPSCTDYAQGLFRRLGTTCGGNLEGLGTPDIGQVVHFDVTGVAPASPTFVMIGTSAPATPLDLIGMPGCQLYVSPFLTLSGTSNGGGHAVFPWQIPDSQGLIGKLFTTQSATIDPGANPFGMTLTNAQVMLIGGWQ